MLDGRSRAARWFTLAAVVPIVCLGFVPPGAGPALAEDIYDFLTFHESYGGIQANDRLGTAFAAGDFDGDGHQDLAVGAVAQDTPTGADQGVVEVIPGNGSGLDFAGRYTLMDPEGTGDGFGAALAAGDFDGNCVDDLVVGVPYEDSGVSDNGIIYVLYGEEGADLVASPDLARHAVFWQNRVDDAEGTAQTPNPSNDRASGDRFGAVLAAGNFNGDRAGGSDCDLDDLVVGVPNEDSNQGAVLVMMGVEAEGLDKFNTTGLNRYWTQADWGANRQNGDIFGAALAVGDFDGDGSDDLAIGAPLNAGGDYGSAHILYGGPSAFTVGVSFSQGDPAGWGVSEDGDSLGEALAAGDFDGDGIDDLAVGSPGEDVGSIVDAGIVNVLYGSPEGLQKGGGQVFDQVLSGLGNTETGDRFGSVLLAGDFVGGPPDDLVIGIPNEDAGAVADTGEVAILFGGFASGRALAYQGDLPAVPRDLILWEGKVFDQTDLGGAEGAGTQDLGSGDRFGLALAAGRITGGFGADLIVGAPYEDWAGVADSGIAHMGIPWPRQKCGRFDATIVGTSGDDLLEGTPGRDVIVGLDGDDSIMGHGGNDLICGGPGDDLIDGGSGTDRIYGNDGDDEIYGGVGADKLMGGPGLDMLDGGGGSDLLSGGAGNDFLVSGLGTDTVSGGRGMDTVSYEWATGGVVVSIPDRTTTGGDTDTIKLVEHIEGSPFADVLTGTTGKNTLWGLGGDDLLYGSAGNDTLLGGSGIDSVFGGLGTDTCEAETVKTCER